MTLGEKIKKLRTEKGISQEELGRLMDVHYTHVSRYERNQSTPSMEALKKLARVFKVSADYLLFDDVEKMAMCVFHDIRPVIPREGGHAFHVIPAACSRDSGQAIRAKRRGWLLGTSFLGVTSSWLSFSASILL